MPNDFDRAGPPGPPQPDGPSPDVTAPIGLDACIL